MGAEYPYVPSYASPADLGSLSFWAQSEYERISIALMGVEEDYTFLINGRMRWRNAWTPGTYQENDVVYDAGWLMVANKETTARPAPQPSGTDEWRIEDIVGAPVFATQTSTDGVYYTGIRFTTTRYGSISAYRWYAPDNSGNFTYEVWVNEVGVRVSQILGPVVPSVVGWQEIPASIFRAAGAVFDLVVVARATTQPSSFAATWQTKNENSNPSDGEAIFRNNATEIRIANTDEDDIDQSAQLALIEVGGTLSFAGLTWTITNITTNGSGAGGRHNFFIEPNQGRPTEDKYTLSFQWGSAAPIPYVVDANHLSADDNVQGFEGTTFPPTVLNENAYGVDVLVDEWIASEDWDIAANSQDISGGGGSGSVQWGAIDGDIKLQTDMQDEFINKSGDTWEQGVTQVFPNDFAGAPDSSDAEVAWINFFGVNAWRVQAATPGTPNGVAYLFLTDRQNEPFPFIVGSKYDGWRCRNQLFDDPDAILTVAEGDSRYSAGGGIEPGPVDGAMLRYDLTDAKWEGISGITATDDGQMTISGPGLIITGSGADIGLDVTGQILARGGIGGVALNANASRVANIAFPQVGTDAISADYLDSKIEPGTADGQVLEWSANQWAVSDTLTLSPVNTTLNASTLQLTGEQFPLFLAKSTGAGVEAFGEFRVTDNANAILSQVGVLSSSNNDLYLRSRVGNVHIQANGFVDSMLVGETFVRMDVPTTVEAQVTINGGTSGGLIINGSGADVSLSCTGQIVANGGAAGIAMNAVNNKITSLANGTATGDAVNLGQLDFKYDKSGGLIDGQVEIDGGTTGGLIVTGSGAGFSIDATGIVLGRSGFNANSNKIVAVAAGTNTGDAVNRGQLNGKANVSHTHAASDVTSGVFDDDRIPALLDKQMTIGGGTSGGLIVTGTGAGYSIDASGVIFGRAGFNAGNSIITAVATPTGATNAANKSYVDTAVSDERLKMNISDDVDSSVIHALNVYSYEYNYDKADFPLSPKYREGRKYGVMAQEAEGVLPEAVYDSTFEGYKAFDYEMLVPLLLKEVQQLRKHVDELRG